ncbi:MAG: deoxyhypusine synthase family protein [Candidatus Thorarchaeota archaeon]
MQNSHYCEFGVLIQFFLEYSIRIHTATEYNGGLSGSTVSESKSLGKYSLGSKNVSIWCDATIALPILINDLVQGVGLGG